MAKWHAACHAPGSRKIFVNHVDGVEQHAGDGNGTRQVMHQVLETYLQIMWMAWHSTQEMTTARGKSRNLSIITPSKDNIL
jgi:hypothetical protein